MRYHASRRWNNDVMLCAINSNLFPRREFLAGSSSEGADHTATVVEVQLLRFFH